MRIGPEKPCHLSASIHGGDVVFRLHCVKDWKVYDVKHLVKDIDLFWEFRSLADKHYYMNWGVYTAPGYTLIDFDPEKIPVVREVFGKNKKLKEVIDFLLAVIPN